MSSQKVLVVEDEKDLRDIYSIILSKAGYEVCTAPNGQAALEDIDACNPKLVLLDIFMPVMDGKGFMERLDHTKHPDMNVIVYSNTSDDTLMNEMIELGADRVVQKSKLSPKDLTALVKEYV